MRIRHPRLHPPASKSKAFAKVVTFRREEDAEKTENVENEGICREGKSEGETSRRWLGEKVGKKGRKGGNVFRVSRRKREDCCVKKL